MWGDKIINMKTEFKNGLKDGIPIALGYLAVSFSMGIMSVSSGLSVFQGAVISATNVTSAGQFAGIKIIAASGTILEMIVTQLIINLRYALMSLSMSQKLSDKITLWQRFVIAFANTDEIFAVAMAHKKSLTFPYMIGLQSLPIIGWITGTILGGVSGNLMSHTLQVATGVALYGMFIAIVIPAGKKSKPVLFTACTAVIISSVIYYVPFLSFISSGISIIVSTIISAGLSAFLFPIKDEEVVEEKDLSRKEELVQL